MRNVLLLIAMVALCVLPFTSRAANDVVGDPTTQPTPQMWETMTKPIGSKGVVEDDVYTIKLTRKDLRVFLEDSPMPAGVLKSEFQFFKCTCGKMEVIGAFCVTDYEANDVIDALRAGAIKIASVAPMMMGDHPRILIVRFHATGEVEKMSKTIKEAMDWTGEARMAPAKRPAAAGAAGKTED